MTSAAAPGPATATGPDTVPARPPRVPKYPAPQIVASSRIEALLLAVEATTTDAGRDAVTAAFWRAVAVSGTPLVESPWPEAPGDRAVTFLWRDRHGARVGTRTVVLLLNKVTDPSVWEQSVLHRIAGTDVWHRTYRLPSTWQGTYQLAPDDGPSPAADTPGAAHGPRSRWAGVASAAVSDPFCARQLAGKPGELPSAVAVLDGAPPQPWRDRRPDAPRGRLTESSVASSRLPGPRRVWSYEPAGDPTPTDLLIVLDGEDWAGRLEVATTLDNLHADGLIPPTAAVLVDAIDTPSRWRDLACDDAFTAFVTGDLLDWAGAELGLELTTTRVVVSGRSLGGLTALYSGLRAPERVDAVIAQSTSLWWPAQPVGERKPGWLQAQLAAAPRLPASITLEVGSEEWLLRDANRDLARALADRGDVDVHLNLYDGGHDAWCWRGSLADQLVRLAAYRTPAA